MKIAACPLLHEELVLLCSTVDCEECGLLAGLLEEIGDPEQVCSGCLKEEDSPIGYHVTGLCDRCGEDRLILLPCTTNHTPIQK